MVKIESLKDYIGVLNEDDFIRLSKQIYDITDFICEDYPKHKEWYFHKQIPRIFTPNGEILFARSEEDYNKIIAMACLKKDDEEQKICTLYVSDQCRGQHLGTRMVEASMEFLGTTKPLITLADYKLPMFQPIIDKYDWELTEVVCGLYNDRAKELCFNGKLTKENINEQTKKVLKKIEFKIEETLFFYFLPHNQSREILYLSTICNANAVNKVVLPLS